MQEGVCIGPALRGSRCKSYRTTVGSSSSNILTTRARLWGAQNGVARGHRAGGFKNDILQRVCCQLTDSVELSTAREATTCAATR
jgi:hypothetical protein